VFAAWPAGGRSGVDKSCYPCCGVRCLVRSLVCRSSAASPSNPVPSPYSAQAYESPASACGHGGTVATPRAWSPCFAALCCRREVSGPGERLPLRCSIPGDNPTRFSTLDWIVGVQIGEAPYFGQFGHFTRYAPVKLDYAVTR